MSYIRSMKLYNIRLPDELSYALKQAGADHVRQTLASSYGVDCKTTRDKPVPPERKTTKERKTKEVAVKERKTTEPISKVVEEHSPEDYVIPGVASWVEPAPSVPVESPVASLSAWEDLDVPESLEEVHPEARGETPEHLKQPPKRFKVFDPQNPMGSRPDFNNDNARYIIWQKEKKEHADSLRVNLTGARQA